jgi:arsenical pump membrane protein
VLWHQLADAAGQTWPPFVLVTGLLLVGESAANDRLFEAIGARIARARLGPRPLLLALLALVAVVTAVLNLDTAVVFLTPVLVHAARRRGVDERPFLYGTVFMANSASLLLPGSNLTNLLVVRGATHTPDMLPGWLAACAVTAAFVAIAFPATDGRRVDAPEPPPLRLRTAAVVVVLAAVAIVALPHPALPVLALGLVAAVAGRRRPRVGAPTLVLLFALAVGVGTAARSWSGARALLAGRGPWATAVVAAAAAVGLNNLPAAVLLSAQPPAHPAALLVGLDLGPNLAVTGSLSALLWLRAARSIQAVPSVVSYSRLGMLLVPLTVAAALLAG